MRPRFIAALVVAAIASLTACDSGQKVAGTPPTGRGQRPMTAGVPVKVTLPPEVAAGTDFPIIVEFQGWTKADETFALDYSNTSLLGDAPRNPLADSPFTVVMASAADNPAADEVLLVTATANGQPKFRCTEVRKRSATAPTPSPAGKIRSVSVSPIEALPGGSVNVNVDMEGYSAAATANATYVSSSGRYDAAPVRPQATGTKWSFAVPIPLDARSGSVCSIGVSMLSDRSDIRWTRVRVK
jgi:hypothetical protein